MAISFKEFPWYIQALVFLALAILIVLAGEFTPYSPVQQTRNNLAQAYAEYSKLNAEVTQLQVYKREYAEFQKDMEALRKQLDTLKTIVPEEKELDEFMRLLQGASAASGVQIRRMTAQAVNAKEFHYEMPFELQVDGPYYNILDFFARLSRLSRIINVGDLSFTGLDASRGPKFPMRAGTTVTGTLTATTFFTKAAETTPGKVAPKQPGKTN